MKKFLPLFVIALGMILLSACATPAAVAQKVVVLPDKLQALIGLGVLYVVGLLLRGRVPDEWVMEIAAAITTAVITVIGVLLRLIPANLEGVANAVLTLIVVLLGSLSLVRGLFVAFGKRHIARQIHLMN